MLKVIKPSYKAVAFLTGMAKAFDMGNHRRVFNRRLPVADTVLYGDEKTDIERLAEDWVAIGMDMQEAIGIVGGRNGK